MNYIEKDPAIISPEGIVAIFFKNNSHPKFYNSVFHRELFKLQQEDEYKDILKCIRFSGSQANPYSEEVATALSNLQYSGAISRQNPDLVKYSITPYFNEAYEILTSGISSSTIGKVNEMCNKLSL